MKNKSKHWPPDYEIDAKGTARRLEQIVEDVEDVLEAFRYGKGILCVTSQERLIKAVKKARGET